MAAFQVKTTGGGSGFVQSRSVAPSGAAGGQLSLERPWTQTLGGWPWPRGSAMEGAPQCTAPTWQSLSQTPSLSAPTLWTF